MISCYSVFILLLTVLFFSVCKQPDRLEDAMPIGVLHDLPVVPQPATKKYAGKVSKGGRGSWAPPNIISPK
jgi:hypothetical protein